MGLLNGGAAKIFAGVFKGIYLKSIYHDGTLSDDGKGGGSRSFTDHDCMAAYEEMSEAQRREEGYMDTDQRIFVLAFHEGQPIPEITGDGEITVDGERWSIETVRRDPARAYYDIRGRTSANAAGI